MNKKHAIIYLILLFIFMVSCGGNNFEQQQEQGVTGEYVLLNSRLRVTRFYDVDNNSVCYIAMSKANSSTGIDCLPLPQTTVQEK